MSVSNVIKSVQDIMRQDAGVDGDAQRISQLVWMIFLKVFDAKEEEWELEYDDYESVIPEELRWGSWASDDEGITGDELLDFINNKLFKELKEMELGVDSDPKAFLVKAVFGDSYNYMKSGALIRQVVNKLNEIDFTASEDRHLFNDIYENILRDLQSAGNSGEFYTPRPVTQFIIDILNPQLGEKVADFACGTGGFLTCAIEHLKKQQKSVEDIEMLGQTIIGVEKKPLPHLLATTNLILHDIDVPNVAHDNSLTKDIRDLKESDYVDVIAMNPPFGGIEEDSVLINFPNNFQTKETADLFMTVIMYRLSEKGRAGVVLPDGFLFGEGVKTKIKEKLLSEFNLHTIVRMPNGVFAPYTGINTNLLFFEKGEPTKDVWFFEHPLPKGYKNYTKTKPIKSEEFDLEKKWWNDREENEYAWKISIDEIKNKNYNLDFKNPNKEEEEFEDPEILLEKYHQAKEEVSKLQDALIEELRKILEV
ncbi:type I restriction-modification system subunit M [Intestinibacter bartlettii]|uniref:type I restriction-modification system subunit M n=1 Tax=Intestinibacter bartlettii TaxID=261299 RepID=UPI0034A54DDF